MSIKDLTNIIVTRKQNMYVSKFYLCISNQENVSHKYVDEGKITDHVIIHQFVKWFSFLFFYWLILINNVIVFDQTVSCDGFSARTHAHRTLQFSAARTSHARVRFSKIQGALAHARFNDSKFLKQIFKQNFHFFNVYLLLIWIQVQLDHEKA